MGSHISGEVEVRDPARRILDSIRRIVQLLRESSREAEALGLSGAQLFVLRTAADSPGLSVGALAERTRTHQSSVSVVVARLVEQGLLERTTAPDDSRRAEVRLTPDGLRRIRSTPPTAQERLVAALDALPKASRSRLASVLDALVQELALGSTHPEMFFQDSEERARKARLANV
jgi:DNA-binding MarR family transcriptional regulator